MTTATDALLAEIQNARAEVQGALGAMLDPLDIPGTWTERQRGAYRDRRVRLEQHLAWGDTLRSQLEKAVARRAALTPPRDRLRSAHATIEQMIKDAPDYRTIVDAREQRHEWARQNGLTASLTAITRGVEYVNGQPALPSPLRELLTDVCPHCGHAALTWPGPLDALDKALAEADAVIASIPAALASLRANVKPHLAEATVPVPAA